MKLCSSDQAVAQLWNYSEESKSKTGKGTSHFSTETKHTPDIHTHTCGQAYETYTYLFETHTHIPETYTWNPMTILCLIPYLSTPP